jgi:translocation and assembly module TamB
MAADAGALPDDLPDDPADRPRRWARGRAPRPSGRRWRLWQALLAALAVLVALLAGAVAYVWNSASAQHALLRHVPGLAIDGARGRLTGGALEIQHLEWHSDSLRVIVDDLSWRDARWGLRPYSGSWGRMALDQPHARRIQVINLPAPKPAKPSPLQPPQDLRLPVDVAFNGLAVDVLQIDQLAPVTALQADLHVGADEGALHRLDRLALDWSGIHVDGRATLGSGRGMPATGVLQLATVAGAATPWNASLRLAGSLVRLNADALLQAADKASANVEATLAPFEAWPLLALKARLDKLDLSALLPALPQTQLTGDATLTDSAAGQPLVMRLALSNGLAGVWDARRLPVRSLDVVLQGRPDNLHSLNFDALNAELGGRQAAGRIRGTGRWADDALTVQARLEKVLPDRIDGRAPAMTLDGSVNLSMRGLASPAPAPAQSGASAAAAPAADGLRGDLKLDIAGRLPRRGAPPVALAGDAEFALPGTGGLRLKVPKLQASAGTARATASADATQDARGSWHLQTQGELVHFDPATWFPATAARQASDLNGNWKADLSLPVRKAAQPLLDALRGDAVIKLTDSRLVGVPLQGQGTLKAAADALHLDALLEAAQNRLQLKGSTNARTQQWKVDLQAPALAALAPLGKLVPGSAEWLPTSGSVTAQASIDGRWPTLRTEGTLLALGVRSPAVQAERADLRWRLTSNDADAPIALDATITGLRQGERRLDRLKATLEGSLRTHRFQVDATSPLRPPVWADALQGGASAPGGSAFLVRARGTWQPAANGGGAWRGTVEQLQAVARESKAAPWLSASGIDAEIRLDPAGNPERVSLAPGRVAAFGGALSWQQASWQTGGPGGTPVFDFEAALDPLKIAPILSRLQPEFGWSGDLGVGASIKLHSAQGMSADVVVERSGGDLGITLDGVKQVFGLTRLRLALAARNGNWSFEESVAGSNLGTVTGQQTVRASAQAPWPAADAPLQGSLALDLPDLAGASPWLPVGWRLGGQLRGALTLAGSLGAPLYQGSVTGSALALRNIFEGVNLRDGALAIALRGTDARVERFEFKGAGDAGGTLRATGDASFGASPQAQLRIVADQFKALDRIDRRIAISGNADVALRDKTVRVGGGFKIDNGLIDVSRSDAPHNDSDVVVVNRPGEPPLPPPDAIAKVGKTSLAPANPTPRAIVDLRVDLGDALRLRGSGLDTRLGGQLRITTPQGRLAVTGVIQAVDGTYSAYGQNLVIDHGSITFSGEVANPRLDILAVRPDIDIRVGVVVSGQAANPRVRLYSEPGLSDFDTLTWLVLGRAPEGVGRDDTALLQRAALALLAGQRGASDGIVSKLGLDSLSVHGSTNNGVTGTVVSLGKQISKRLYVGYEHALSGTGGTLELIYRIASRITVRARAGADTSIQTIWTWRWD